MIKCLKEHGLISGLSYLGPLICISLFVPVPYCLDYCSFVVHSEVRKIDSSSSILLSQDYFGYSGSWRVLLGSIHSTYQSSVRITTYHYFSVICFPSAWWGSKEQYTMELLVTMRRGAWNLIQLLTIHKASLRTCTASWRASTTLEIPSRENLCPGSAMH